MTTRQTRAFFVGGTALFALIFVALTVDSHRRFGRITHSENITPAVLDGEHVWHRNDCTNCHTLLGEGAYYAPDLTHIASQRGAPYLQSFLQNPGRFYSEQRDRRLMPTPNLTGADRTRVIAFLGWIDRIDNQGWPPRPILVTGAATPGMAGAPAAGPPASTDPVALGQTLFHTMPPGCFACHSTAPGTRLDAPSLAGIGTRAAQRVRQPDYHGTARDAAGYVRESILQPSAYIVPGPLYSSGGQSMMPANFAQSLTPAQLDALVAYLLTLK